MLLALAGMCPRALRGPTAADSHGAAAATEPANIPTPPRRSTECASGEGALAEAVTTTAAANPAPPAHTASSGSMGGSGPDKIGVDAFECCASDNSESDGEEGASSPTPPRAEGLGGPRHSICNVTEPAASDDSEGLLEERWWRALCCDGGASSDIDDCGDDSDTATATSSPPPHNSTDMRNPLFASLTHADRGTLRRCFAFARVLSTSEAQHLEGTTREKPAEGMPPAGNAMTSSDAPAAATTAALRCAHPSSSSGGRGCIAAGAPAHPEGGCYWTPTLFQRQVIDEMHEDWRVVAGQLRFHGMFCCFSRSS